MVDIEHIQYDWCTPHRFQCTMWTISRCTAWASTSINQHPTTTPQVVLSVSYYYHYDSLPVYLLYSAVNIANPSLLATMTSATGIPDNNLADEQQPLLGDAQTTTQSSHQGLQFNLVTGTAIIAQAGIWILAALVSYSYLHKF